MRTITEEIELYKFNEASKELKAKIISQFNSDGYHYEHNMSERIDTLKVIAKILEANLDYALSCVPDRGEHITFKPIYTELNFQALWEVINQDKDCPLTGHCYDHDFIDHLSKYTLLSPDSQITYRECTWHVNNGLKDAATNYIEAIHEEYEDMLSEEYINDMCEANDYEFTIDGKIYA